ncbi:MAG: fasciclin domain-containing protein [Granulosicoccaceae bacterium]
MIKKYLGLCLITASMLVMGCSSDDDGPADTTGSTTGGAGPTFITVPPTVTFPEPLPDGWVEPTLNVVDTATGDTNLSSLAAAITRANLGATLGDAAQTFTVFAPSDAAFAALPDGTIASMADEDLTDLLRHHVVSGALDGAGVAAGAGSSVTMLNGDVLAITDDGAGNLSIGGAPISATDTYTTNGIIHIIDMVLIPPADMPDTTGTTTDATTGTTTTDTGTTGGDPVGAGEQAVIDNGNTDYVAAFFPTGQFATANLTDSAWTVFAPTNAALAGAALTKAQIDNSIYTDTAPLAPAALTDGLTLNMFGGASHAVTNDGTDITVGGFPVTVIYEGTAIIYSIDGIL